MMLVKGVKVVRLLPGIASVDWTLALLQEKQLIPFGFSPACSEVLCALQRRFQNTNSLFPHRN